MFKKRGAAHLKSHWLTPPKDFLLSVEHRGCFPLKVALKRLRVASFHILIEHKPWEKKLFGEEDDQTRAPAADLAQLTVITLRPPGPSAALTVTPSLDLCISRSMELWPTLRPWMLVVCNDSGNRG